MFIHKDGEIVDMAPTLPCERSEGKPQGASEAEWFSMSLVRKPDVVTEAPLIRVVHVHAPHHQPHLDGTEANT